MVDEKSKICKLGVEQINNHLDCVKWFGLFRCALGRSWPAWLKLLQETFVHLPDDINVAIEHFVTAGKRSEHAHRF